MFLTKLAFKNLVRHRKRTVITASIIAVAIFIFILFDSLIGGMTQLSYNSIIKYEAGHLQVADKKYWAEKDEMPLENLIKTDKETINQIEKLEGYQAVSPEINFIARLNNGANELPVMAKGVTPEKYMEVIRLKDQFVDGEMFSSGADSAVLGKRLAEIMQLEVGDYITLVFKDKNETFNTLEARISGLVHTGNPNVNRNIVYLPQKLVQQSLSINNNVSKLIVRLEDKNIANSAAVVFNDKISSEDNIAAYPWSELETVSIAGAKQSANMMILAVILLIAAIAIINTVILAALERMEEIGMMKAQGLKNTEIIYTFVLESIGIGLLGGIIGVILGAAGVWFLTRYGIDFAALTNLEMSSFGIPVLGKFYGTWNPGAMLKVFLFGVLVSLLASILPAYWAADKDPVKAIYHR